MPVTLKMAFRPARQAGIINQGDHITYCYLNNLKKPLFPAQGNLTDHGQIIRLKIDSFADFVQADRLAVALPGHDQPPEIIHSITHRGPTRPWAQAKMK